MRGHIRDAQSGRSSSAFANAIRKYEEDQWEWWIIDDLDSSSDADVAEEHYIETLETHYSLGGYNLCLGGSSRRGFRQSEETRLKIGIASKGNRYAEGMMPWFSGSSIWAHMDEAKRDLFREKARRRSIGNKLSIGNTSNRRPVRCIDTNIVYPSASHAALELTGKFSPGTISDACRGATKTAYGYRWEYVDNRTQGKGNMNRQRPVKCIESGKEYRSALEASRDLGMIGSCANIAAACKGSRATALGYHWAYITKEANVND